MPNAAGVRFGPRRRDSFANCRPSRRSDSFFFKSSARSGSAGVFIAECRIATANPPAAIATPTKTKPINASAVDIGESAPTAGRRRFAFLRRRRGRCNGPTLRTRFAQIAGLEFLPVQNGCAVFVSVGGDLIVAAIAAQAYAIIKPEANENAVGIFAGLKCLLRFVFNVRSAFALQREPFMPAEPAAPIARRAISRHSIERKFGGKIHNQNADDG